MDYMYKHFLIITKMALSLSGSSAATTMASCVCESSCKYVNDVHFICKNSSKASFSQLEKGVRLCASSHTMQRKYFLIETNTRANVSPRTWLYFNTAEPQTLGPVVVPLYC